MRFGGRRSFLRGGLYHLALIIVAGAAFNWGFLHLTGVDLVGRVSAGLTVPPMVTAAVLCASAVLVLWNNWVD